MVSLVLPYAPARGGEEAAPNAGIISRYALGSDYHGVVSEKLDKLIASLRSQLGEHVHGKGYADSGPLMEVELAVLAGLGWRGKHTLLVSPEYGSWHFLCELLLNTELPTTASEMADRCGTCTRCIDACPTGAFPEPYVLDARRCISYLTVELRGSIPRELRPLIGARIFGCDVCQDVCPWNRAPEITEEPALQPREDLLAADLIELVRITSAEFRRRFAGSPLLRARRAGFVRNVAVALGNVGDERAVEPLRDALTDGSAVVRAHAGWALARVIGRNAWGDIRAAIDRESDAETWADLKATLAEMEKGSAEANPSE